MTLQLCFTASEDVFPLSPAIRDRYGPFGFPRHELMDRPYVSSNFVTGLDGRVSFRELTGRAGGKEVSRSIEDRWLMDFLRAHHDAQLMGATTMREEPGLNREGWDFAIDDDELRCYRQETLKLDRQKIIIVTGAGGMDFSLRLFNSPRVEPWILTTADTEPKLQSQINKALPSGAIRIVIVGEGAHVDLKAALKILRQDYGIQTLLCEGGPTLYGELLSRHLIDEEFRTISLQVLGDSTVPGIARPTPYGTLSYTPETAPWFTLVSIHYALPYHAFFRYRYLGPRNFKTQRPRSSKQQPGSPFGAGVEGIR